MYKRPARVLVAALDDDGRAAFVAQWAADPALSRWLEVRPAGSMRQLNPDDLHWADLLVALDAAAAQALPAERPSSCRLKRWSLPPADSPDLPGAVAAAIFSMIGGMRMLSRVDEDDERE
ncbi:precorrin-3B synthase [Thioalkalivibrio sp.]|uniref:precorrin-3B synthase n=1 Tax=Thioalkalivibrio sp. TaxID=2093813 RepID=UPI003974BC82